MSEAMQSFQERALTLEELDHSLTFVRLSVKKLRITGELPVTGHRTFFPPMSRHLQSGELEELTLTTNGSQLERFATDLYAAGVRRINVSLDTLDEDKFARVTRWGRLPQVLRGLDAAQKAGLRIKINAVALKGFNEDELLTITQWCASRDMDLTWIEVMPMGDLGGEDRVGQYWSLRDVRDVYASNYIVRSGRRIGGPAMPAGRNGLDWLHYTAKSQFLRKLQPGASDLHG